MQGGECCLHLWCNRVFEMEEFCWGEFPDVPRLTEESFGLKNLRETFVFLSLALGKCTLLNLTLLTHCLTAVPLWEVPEHNLAHRHRGHVLSVIQLSCRHSRNTHFVITSTVSDTHKDGSKDFVSVVSFRLADKFKMSDTVRFRPLFRFGNSKQYSCYGFLWAPWDCMLADSQVTDSKLRLPNKQQSFFLDVTDIKVRQNLYKNIYNISPRTRIIWVKIKVMGFFY